MAWRWSRPSGMSRVLALHQAPASRVQPRQRSPGARRLARTIRGSIPRRLPRVLAQNAKQLREVGRDRCLQGQRLARSWRIESQCCGLQGLALETAQSVEETLRRTARQAESPPVHRIPDDRIPDVRQMEANLVGSAGL